MIAAWAIMRIFSSFKLGLYISALQLIVPVACVSVRCVRCKHTVCIKLNCYLNCKRCDILQCNALDSKRIETIYELNGWNATLEIAVNFLCHGKYVCCNKRDDVDWMASARSHSHCVAAIASISPFQNEIKKNISNLCSRPYTMSFRLLWHLNITHCIFHLAFVVQMTITIRFAFQQTFAFEMRFYIEYIGMTHATLFIIFRY